MKSITILLSLIAITTYASSNAQTSGATGEEEQQLVKIATLSTIEANQEFQQNVRIMQAAREFAIQLNKKLDESTDDSEKAELQVKLEEAMADLNDNNKKMIENYGFSLNRNYVLVVEKAHIYMHVTPEEAAKVEEKLASEGASE